MSLITVVMVAVLVFLSRHDIAHAWHLLGQVDLRILWLVIPLIVLSYLATGEAMFSYLRQKKLIKNVSPFLQLRMSMELNFVNHVLPSGGLSGMSYMNWRLGKFGVPSGRATMSQIVRFAMMFAATTCMLAIAVVAVTIDGSINRWIILMSSLLVTLMLIVTIIVVYFLRSESRIRRIATVVSRGINGIARRITGGRRRVIIRNERMEVFLLDIHKDYMELRRDKRLLIQPFWWNILYAIVEVATYWTVFWALGSVVNPAAILVGYGLAGVMGIVFVTPGGTGAYETVMVLVLSFAGVPQGEAIAGVVLTRMIVLAVAVFVGYVFYQHALIRYGGKKELEA